MIVFLIRVLRHDQQSIGAERQKTQQTVEYSLSISAEAWLGIVAWKCDRSLKGSPGRSSRPLQLCTFSADDPSARVNVAIVPLCKSGLLQFLYGRLVKFRNVLAWNTCICLCDEGRMVSQLLVENVYKTSETFAKITRFCRRNGKLLVVSKWSQTVALSNRSSQIISHTGNLHIIWYIF